MPNNTHDLGRNLQQITAIEIDGQLGPQSFDSIARAGKTLLYAVTGILYRVLEQFHALADRQSLDRSSTIDAVG